MNVPVPSHPRVTTPFGKPGSWAAGFHTGDDYGSPGIHGVPVAATASGTVVYSGTNGGWGSAYGIQVIIDSGGRRHLYAHLSSRSVSYGQRVSAGQTIGTVGNTGRSFGPHLHYEERVSPYRYGSDARRPQLSTGTAPATAATPDCFGAYCFGKQRAAHRALQRRLAEKGCDPGFGEWPTRLYGKGTRAAVAAFQRDLGWSGSDADGLLGPGTLNKLGLPRGWRLRRDKCVYASAMHMGSADSDSVWNVQVALMLRGYSIPAGPTDFFGKQTRDAVRQFQQDRGRTGKRATGIPDAGTVKALRLTWVDDLPDHGDDDDEELRGGTVEDREDGSTESADLSAARYPKANWDPVPGFDGLRRFAGGGGPKIIVHTTESDTKPNWASLGSGIPHFTIDPGADRVWQHLGLDVAAYTLKGGEHSPNSGGGVAIQIEVVGHAKDTAQWSPDRYRSLRRLVRWVAGTIGAPEVSPFPFCGSDGAGRGGEVRQSWTRFQSASGVIGHAHVPYNDHWDPGMLDPARLLGSTATPPGPTTSTRSTARVPLITFNIPRRYDAGGTLKDTALLSALMAESDVLGLQEAGWARGLVDSLGWTVHQPTDSTGKPVGQLLAWNPAAWDTVDLGTTLLSPATRVQRKAAGPTLHREKLIVWADLRRTDTGQVWNLAVVHFVPSKHMGGQTRALWIRQRDELLAWMGRQGPRTAVLGDFNAQPRDSLAAPLLKVAQVQAAVSHGRRRIDWVVHKPGLRPVADTSALSNMGQSDHRPVRAVLSG